MASSCQDNCCCRCMNTMRQIVADCLSEVAVKNNAGGWSWRIPDPPAKRQEASA